MVLPVLADMSWFRRICFESRNQHRNLEPNSAVLREEKENTRRAGWEGRRKSDRNHLLYKSKWLLECICVLRNYSGFFVCFVFFRAAPVAYVGSQARG